MIHQFSTILLTPPKKKQLSSLVTFIKQTEDVATSASAITMISPFSAPLTLADSYIGLTKEYANRNVRFPFSCYLQILSNDIISYSWRSTTNFLFKLIVGNLLHFAFANPVVFVLSSLILYCLYWTKKTWKMRENDREHVSKLKDSTYERLINLEVSE